MAGGLVLADVLKVGATINQSFITVAEPYPMTTANGTVHVNPSVDIIVTLPTAVGNAGLTQTVTHVGTANTVTLASAGGTINGETTQALMVGDSMTVTSNGTNWRIG